MIEDIPGLIEGASYGAGLGHRFLKHLERCRVLVHLVDVHPVDESNPVDNVMVIENELKQYAHDLYEKPRWLVANKVDLGTPEEAQEALDAILKLLRSLRPKNSSGQSLKLEFHPLTRMMILMMRTMVQSSSTETS